jgi:hypothetical protein
MSWEIIGSISALIASIATLLTLVYLAIQVRESNKLARDASLQSVLDGYSDRAVQQAIESPEKIQIYWKGHLDYTKLSFNDKSVFDAMMTREVFHLRNVMQHYQNGLIDDKEYESWLSFVSSQVITPGGHKCWERVKVSYLPDVVEAIEGFIKINPSIAPLTDLYPDKVNGIKKILEDKFEE